MKCPLDAVIFSTSGAKLSLPLFENEQKPRVFLPGGLRAKAMAGVC